MKNRVAVTIFAALLALVGFAAGFTGNVYAADAPPEVKASKRAAVFVHFTLEGVTYPQDGVILSENAVLTALPPRIYMWNDAMVTVIKNDRVFSVSNVFQITNRRRGFLLLALATELPQGDALPLAGEGDEQSDYWWVVTPDLIEKFPLRRMDKRGYRGALIVDSAGRFWGMVDDALKTKNGIQTLVFTQQQIHRMLTRYFGPLTEESPAPQPHDHDQSPQEPETPPPANPEPETPHRQNLGLRGVQLTV